jgi:hypothetical protein
MGIDDMVERRKGQKITAKGIYRDPVRSECFSVAYRSIVFYTSDRDDHRIDRILKSTKIISIVRCRS